MRRLFCFIVFLFVVFGFPLPAQDEISLDHIDNLDIYNDELFYQEWYLFSNAADKFFSMSSSDFTQELVRGGVFFIQPPRTGQYYDFNRRSEFLRIVRAIFDK